MARVLAVGNMYPPHHLGGYEVLWRSSVGALRAAGHDVRVVTTDVRFGDGAGEELDPGVHRELRWYWREHAFPRLGLRARLALERANAHTLDRHLDDHRPDVVTWWAMGGMSLALLDRARRRGLPALGVVGDDWMTYAPRVDQWTRAWARVPAPLAAAGAGLTGVATRPALGGVRWLFISDYVRRTALAHRDDLDDTDVVHPGIDPARFPPAPPRPAWEGRLVYSGRIDERKGIADAIEAVAALPGTTLRVDGGGDEAHLGELRALAGRLGLGARVTFDRSPREELAAVYASADALLFPVRWPEPWGLVPLEAMSVGRPVVATGTGGSAEYLRDGENCLLVPPRDSAALAGAVRRLAGDGGLRARLVDGARATAARFTEAGFDARVVSEVERLAGGRRARPEG